MFTIARLSCAASLCAVCVRGAAEDRLDCQTDSASETASAPLPPPPPHPLNTEEVGRRIYLPLYTAAASAAASQQKPFMGCLKVCAVGGTEKSEI
jgi:hypothetical protein